MGTNSITYPGCYASAVKQPLNQQANVLVKGLNDEILHKQACVKADFLKHTLDTNKTFTKSERAAVEDMLRDAQRELAQLEQKLNAKYPV